MKKIFEEYGGVLIVVLVVIGLVSILGLVVGGKNGGMVGESIDSIITDLSKGESGPIVTDVSENRLVKYVDDEAGDTTMEWAFGAWASDVKGVEFTKRYPDTMNVISIDKTKTSSYYIEAVEQGYAVDMSAAGDKSVVAYIKDGILYISGKDGVVMAGEDCTGMFAGLSKVEYINFNGCFNTQNATKMTGMFAYCEKLQSLDLSGFETSGVVHFGGMFAECRALKYLDVSNFDTSDTESMEGMFARCESLRKLYLTSFETTSLGDARSIFEGCKSMRVIYVNKYWSLAVADSYNAFENCGVSEVTVVDAQPGVDGVTEDSSTNMLVALTGDYALSDWAGNDVTKIVFLRNYDETMNIVDDVMDADFSNAVDLSESGTRAVIGYLREEGEEKVLYIAGKDGVVMGNASCSQMFYGLRYLREIDFNNAFNTSNVTSMASMFSGCSALESLDLSGFDTSNVTTMQSMFSSCTKLESLNVKGFNTSAVKSMAYMFSGCASLEYLNLKNFDTSNVTTMAAMFSSSGIKRLDMSNLDTSNVTTMLNMFWNCKQLIQLDVSGFRAGGSVVTTQMFRDCTSLKAVNLGNFNAKSSSYSRMFYNCSALETLDLSKFDSSNVITMAQMFYGCSSLRILDVSNFDTQKTTNVSNIFNGCTSLNTIYVGPKTNFIAQGTTTGWNANSIVTEDTFVVKAA